MVLLLNIGNTLKLHNMRTLTRSGYIFDKIDQIDNYFIILRLINLVPSSIFYGIKKIITCDVPQVMTLFRSLVITCALAHVMTRDRKSVV